MYYIILTKRQKLKPNVAALRDKTCQNRRFIYFHEFPEASGIYRPEHGNGKYTVAIVVREGPGLPLIRKGSHVSTVRDFSRLELLPASTFSENSVIVFHANIVREDPKVGPTGAAAIVLLY